MKKLGVFILITILSLSSFILIRENWGPFNKEPADIQGNDVVIDPEPVVETTEVTLYFINKKYIQTGNENLEKIIPIKRQINKGNKSLESAILEELKKAPEDSNLVTSMANLKILSVETIEETAFVNFSSSRLSGGSLQEANVLNQVIYSLTELDHVKQVQFLIDGSKSETLMGHITIEEPFKRP